MLNGGDYQGEAPNYLIEASLVAGCCTLAQLFLTLCIQVIKSNVKVTTMGKDPTEEAERGGGGRRRRKRSTVADWEAVNAAILLRAIASVSRSGGALRLGYSRDGGAFAVGVYGDGEPYTEFEHDTSNLEALLGDLAQWFDDNEATSQNRPRAKK
jgi:hypothetical protein